MANEGQLREFVEKMRIPTFDEDAKVVVETLLRIVSNVVRFPGEPRFRMMRVNNPVVSKMVNLYEQSLGYLTLLGFEFQTVNGEQQIVLSKGKENMAELKAGLKILKETALDLGMPKALVDNVTGQSSKVNTMKFNPYASMVVSVGVAPKPNGSNSRMEKEVQRLKEKREKIMNEAGVPQRNLRVFEPSSSKAARRFSRISAITATASSVMSKDDSKLLKEVVKDQQESQRRSQQFSTKAMRELQKLKNSKVFTRSLIRIQFPDRTILEMCFSPAEVVGDVLAEVNSCLKSARATPVYLYQTPPLRRLDLTATLDKCGLKPAALIYAGWEKQAPTGEYLRDDLVEKLNRQKGQVVEKASFPKTSVPLIHA
mmetsp:Transcript_6768/g.7775  ORF Transcript_6768/g.7775 Transcript_6768/m.7775 type:complete len:370 (-) Transcript_6768:81-1190(-)